MQVPEALSPELKRVPKALDRLDYVDVALAFGSLATGRESSASDLDVAVASEGPLTAQQRTEIVSCLPETLGRPVDLVNLLSDGGPVLKQAVTTGRLLIVRNTTRWGQVINRMLAHETDFMPIYWRILKDRREAWIGQ